MKDLREPVEQMTSADYKERFKAEYWQTKIRYEKLKAFNTRIEAANAVSHETKRTIVEMPEHDCPEWVLREQQTLMGNYLHMLEIRALIEGIDICE